MVGIGVLDVGMELTEYTDRDNAYMLTLPDGIPAWSGMFLWEPINDTFEGPYSDGNFDASVIEHEYAHGLSNRAHQHAAGHRKRGTAEGTARRCCHRAGRPRPSRRFGPSGSRQDPPDLRSLADPVIELATTAIGPLRSVVPMADDPQETRMAPFSANQDLLRGTGGGIPAADVDSGMRWLRDGGPPPSPLSVHLDVTFRCTARCAHCAQWTWKERPDLEVARIDTLVETLGRWRVRTVTLGGGNPLLHPHLGRIAYRLRAAGIRVGLISEGGVEIAPETVRMVDECLSWIRFSIDGASREIHDRIRGTDGLFDTTTAGIRRLREAGINAPVGINFVVQRRNMHQIGPMVALAQQLDVDVLLFKLPHGSDPRNRYVPTAAEWAGIRDQVTELDRASPGRMRTNLSQFAAMLDELDPTDVAAGRPVRGHYAGRGARCFVPLFFLVIDAAGDVYPCDYLQADTRTEADASWRSRSAYCAGNVFDDGDAVLDRLSDLFRTTVHELPGSGHHECGSCTRFFQMNTALTAGHTDGRALGNGVAPFL
ncbi:radical SAM protein [Micromonospora sp. DT47]|uniref:radical SAM protein n=1 Tax=Micromonospora sp. DT47 TaxID=3393431 RepID=UPI003CF44173